MSSSMSIMLCVAQFVGIVGAAFTSGSILSVSLIAIPALKAPKVTLPDTAVRFRTLALTGRKIMPSLAVLSTSGFGFLAWKVPSARMAYSIAAGCTIGIVPFTLLLLLRTTFTLMSKTEVVEPKSRGAEDENWEKLLDRWMFMNGVRAMLPLLGALVGLQSALSCHT
ncbi:hypothetical protein V1517DRAFT_351954 [Lipomyces orientalis]|uniref:Uncharacterized protein n=1 Tax=Lipomyces orientalis TaxID=1233043 RepID=A0ACC3TSB9_9ASCO